MIAGCSGNNDTNSNSSQSTQFRTTQTVPVTTIALVMKTLTNPFFIKMERGARRAERELGIHLLVKTAAKETSIQQQINIVDELIRMKVDAIVIAPGDSVELIPVLKQAQDAGIAVVNIDNRLNPEFSKKSGLKELPFISVDNEKAAYQSVKALTRKITQPTSVAILEGIRSAANAEDRKNGALKAFEEHPLTNVVAMETAHWKIDEGFDKTRQLFELYPQIGAIFCANDMMALGTLQYLKVSGRDDVLVASYDALDEARAAVNAGTLVATVDQQASLQGYMGVMYAYRMLTGEKLPPVTLVDTKIIIRQSYQ